MPGANIRQINGVMHNFLGTFTSRYSDYEGYWLFGFLVEKHLPLEIDLLNPETLPNEEKAVMTARKIAHSKFSEQLEKANLSAARLKEAKLFIYEVIPSQKVFANCSQASMIKFQVKAKTISGKIYERESTAIIAPHNPQVERRRAGY